MDERESEGERYKTSFEEMEESVDKRTKSKFKLEKIKHSEFCKTKE